MSAPPLLDPVSAGAAWRASSLADLRAWAQAVGLLDDPEVGALLGAAADAGTDLDALAVSQAADPASAPWWADGEYDGRRAEASNDAGVEALKIGHLGDALAAFTEAVRLAPGRPVFSANRAAAAVRAADEEEGRNAPRPAVLALLNTAFEAAQHAARLDPTYAKAHARAAGALERLGRPAEAAEAWARAGIVGRAAAAHAAAATAPSPPPPPDRSILASTPPPPLEDAAALLAAADAAAAGDPAGNTTTLKIARAEALLLVGRPGDVRGAVAGLAAGSPERLYLEAEAAWRGGAEDLGGVAASLGGFPGRAGELGAWLRTHLGPAGAAVEAEAAAGNEDGCASALGRLAVVAVGPPGDPALFARVAPGLAARLHALAARSATSPSAALASADAALAAVGDDPAALWERARALARRQGRGDAAGACDTLRCLAVVAPGWPGLGAATASAARWCLEGVNDKESSDEEEEEERAAAGGRPAAANAPTAGPAGAYAALGLQPGAPRAAVRAAFAAAARRTHPDKGGSGCTTAFLAARAAYEAIFVSEERA
jgi:tetratricopeptide (TPR) repeat protein